MAACPYRLQYDKYANFKIIFQLSLNNINEIIQNQQYISLNNTHAILIVVHRCAKIKFILFLCPELQAIRVSSLPVLYVNQLALSRNNRQRDCISFVVVPWSVLLIHRRVFWPTIAIVGYLESAVRGSRLKFEHVGFSSFSDGDSHCDPPFDAIHLELDGLLLTADARLHQPQKSAFIIVNIMHF